MTETLKNEAEADQELGPPAVSDDACGLTTEQVDARHAQGQSNQIDTATSRPMKVILRTNLFTVFNGILTVCVIAVLADGDWRDAVFGLVLVMNLAIGIFSEVRSKHTLDSLAVLDSPTSVAVRDGKAQQVPSADLVVDDIIELKLGDQIPADGSVLKAHGLRVDESALTGESKPMRKEPGDELLSGTSVVAGSGTMCVKVIGAESWAQKISAQAKKFIKAQSEIQGSIDRILRWITMALPLIVVLLIWSQLRGNTGDWRSAIIYTVAGVVGMIPQGLVLLTSLNFGIAAATLARKGVLVQELPAVEILARVNVLCLDKTGTLTTGDIRGDEIVPAHDIKEGSEQHQAALQALRLLVSDRTNATAEAAYAMLKDVPAIEVSDDDFLPFNSIRKWSAVVLPDDVAAQMVEAGYADGAKTWIFGAPEVILATSGDQDQWARDIVAHQSSLGHRTVVLASSPTELADEELPEPLAATLILVLEEDVRPDAASTLGYFSDQGVRVKIISGDAPETVGSIAHGVGLTAPDGGAPHVVDARTLPPIDSAEFAPAAEDADVFGRVTPEQKEALVTALQASGHTVGMTGDGVNDALALKRADLGIAMGNGASATKAVAKLVLIHGEFSVLPSVVAEGRRIIANMERVSSLFLSKTTYAILMALAVGIAGFAYPFLPRHLTYISSFTIGIPAFFLALAPNSKRYVPGFLKRTLLVSVPSGITMGLMALTAYLLAGADSLGGHTAATVTLIIGAMALLIVLAKPWKAWKIIMIALLIAGAVLGLVIPIVRDFFALEWPPANLWLIIIPAGVVAAVGVVVAYQITAKWRAQAGVVPSPADLGASTPPLVTRATKASRTSQADRADQTAARDPDAHRS